MALVGCVYTTVEVDDYSSGFHSNFPSFLSSGVGWWFVLQTRLRTLLAASVRRGFALSRDAGREWEN